MPTRSQVLAYLTQMRSATPQDPITHTDVADYLHSLLDYLSSDANVLKTPAALPNQSKGIEIWGTGGAFFTGQNDYVEFSIKSIITVDQDVTFQTAGGFANFIFRSNTTERMRLNRNGNLGIGTNSPQRRLHVAGAAMIDGSIDVNVQARQGLTLFNLADAGRSGYMQVDGDGDFSNRFVVFGASSTAYGFRFVNGATELGRIAANGDWLIGQTTNNASGKLQVNGGIWTNTMILESTSPQLRIRETVAATDMKFNDIFVSNGQINFRLINDAFNAANNWLQVQRAGFSVLNVCFPSGPLGVGTITPDSSALLDLNSTSRGLLVPRMTTAQVNAIVSPANGLIVYDITLNKFRGRENGAWVNMI